MENEMIPLVKRIFDLLAEQGKTAVELGAAVGVKSSSINAWKKGAWPSSRYINAICGFLNVSPNYLFTGIDDKDEATRLLLDMLANLDGVEKQIVLGKAAELLKSKETN